MRLLASLALIFICGAIPASADPTTRTPKEFIEAQRNKRNLEILQFLRTWTEENERLTETEKIYAIIVQIGVLRGTAEFIYGAQKNSDVQDMINYESQRVLTQLQQAYKR